MRTGSPKKSLILTDKFEDVNHGYCICMLNQNNFLGYCCVNTMTAAKNTKKTHYLSSYPQGKFNSMIILQAENVTNSMTEVCTVCSRYT